MHKKLDTLQGLRFLGFVMIFIHHSYWLVTKPAYFDMGGRGVEIFFILSGFLMAYNYCRSDFAYDVKSSFSYMLGKLKKL